MFITIVQIHSTEPELLLALCRRFVVVRISDNDPSWKKKLHGFHWSTIRQKQFNLSVILGQYYHSIPLVNANLIRYLLFIDD